MPVHLEVADDPPTVHASCAETGAFTVTAQDLVGCLMQVRTRLEKGGYLLACQGALPEVWATAAVRSQRPGYAQDFSRRDAAGEPVMVDIFLPVAGDAVVTIKVQRALHAIREVQPR